MMNQTIYYVSNIKPLSHNKAGMREKYKKMHSDIFCEKYGHLYPNIPIRERKLSSKIFYIYHGLRKGTIPDIDNLSKPIVDAFSGIMYEDDRQIIQRDANILELGELEFLTIDYTNMPEEIANDLNDFITSNEQHITLFYVSDIELKDIRIGEI